MSKLNPKLAPWLKDLHKQIADLIAAGYKATAIGAREGLANVASSFIKESPAVAWVNDDLIWGANYTVPVRIYHPAPDQPRPVLIFYHGGGHTVGSVQIYDPICRKLACASGQIVVSVEYRLAPENPYPCGLIDAYTAAQGVFDLLDRRKLPYKRILSIAGDSAGGALASSVSMRAQFDYSLKIANQILIYPSVDYTMRHKSIEENGANYFLTAERIAWYFDNYFQNAEDRYLASPLYGQFSARIPRTLMISAGFDPLRDEAAQYLARLEEVGIPHEHLYFDDMVHAFLFMEDMVKEECERLYKTVGRFLNETEVTLTP